MIKKLNIIIGGIIVFIIFLAVIVSDLNKNKIPDLIFVSSIPQNNSQFIDTKSEIIFTLNRNITEKDGQDIKIKISPNEDIEKVYQENKIRISPETEFKINTKYEIQVIYKEKNLYTLTFTTFPITQEQLISDGAKQTEADLAFGESYKKFLKSYPWYQNIPIEKSEYRIVYDFEKDSFRIRFLSQQTDVNTIQFLTQSALADLKKIGVEEPIKYYTLQPDE